MDGAPLMGMFNTKVTRSSEDEALALRLSVIAARHKPSEPADRFGRESPREVAHPELSDSNQ